MLRITISAHRDCIGGTLYRLDGPGLHVVERIGPRVSADWVGEAIAASSGAAGPTFECVLRAPQPVVIAARAPHAAVLVFSELDEPAQALASVRTLLDRLAC